MFIFCFYFATLITLSASASPSQSDRVNWVRAQEGKRIDFDGYSGAQCVDLIAQYIWQFFGARVLGNAHEYATLPLPDSLIRVYNTQMQPGDIAVLRSSSSYGHVAIVVSVTDSQVTIAEQNVQGNLAVGGPTTITTHAKASFSARLPSQYTELPGQFI